MSPSGGRRPRGRKANDAEATAGSANQTAQNQAETIQPQLVAAVTENYCKHWGKRGETRRMKMKSHLLRNGVAVAKETASGKGTVYDQSNQVSSE